MENKFKNKLKDKSFLSLALALVALALGAASLFVGVNAVQKQKASESSLAAKSDKALATAVESKAQVEEIAKLKREIESLKATIKQSDDSLANVNNAIKTAISQNNDSMNKNMKGAFEYYSKSIAENRELMIANKEAIEKLRTALSAPVNKEEAPVVVDENAEYFIYEIKAGDYFSKLAKQFKVSVEAIEAANPNVSSNLLKIGQKINIPKAQ